MSEFIFSWLYHSYQRNTSGHSMGNLEKSPRLGFPAGCISWDCCGHGALKTGTGKVHVFQTSDHSHWFCEKSPLMVHIILAFAAQNMTLQFQ